MRLSAQNEAKGVMAGFRRDIDTAARAMRRMAIGALAVAGVGGMGYMIKRTMQSIDATAKLSDQFEFSCSLGLSVGLIPISPSS